MLINLLPDFLAIQKSSDRTEAYLRFFESHQAILGAYWDNYVVSPDTPHFEEVLRKSLAAERSDLNTMLERTDVVALARAAETETKQLLEADVDVDVVLMVGVGAANAGELVVNGKGVAFVCLEHFTGVQNPETDGLGLDPELIPMWLAHEIAHAVRYTSPTSRAEMSEAVGQAEGYYSYWDTGRYVRFKEHLLNEGLATVTSREVSVGHAAWQYYGYGRRQFARIREMEPIISAAIASDLERTGLGLRLRYLSGGMTDEARTVDRHVLPERSGYYVGTQMAERVVRAHGLAWAVRAHADELLDVRIRSSASA